MNEELTDILSLIAATVFADKRVLSSEIDVFIKATSKLNIVMRLEPKVSEAKLLAWYEMNKDDISQKLATPYFKDWLYGVLERLKHIPEQDSILEVMNKISHADGNVHVSERALVALSERYWRETSSG